MPSDAKEVLVRNVGTGQLGYVPAAKLDTFLEDPDYRLAEAGELEAERKLAENQTLAGKAETVITSAAENIADSAQTALRVLDSAPARAVLPGSGLALGAGKYLANQAGIDLMDPGRSLVGQTAGAILGGNVEKSYAERVRELQQANPGAWTGGEVLGGVTTGLLTGGGSALAGEGILAGLTQAGVKPGLARALATGGAMAAEGGFYGAAATETQARLAGKTDGASAEELLQGIGLGALIGGGMGVGGSATMSAFRKLVARADELAPVARAEATAAGSAVKGFENTGGDALPKLQSTLTGADLQTLREFGAQNQSAAAIEGRSLWRRRSQIIDEAVPKMTEALDHMDQAIDAVTSNVKQFELKRSGVASMLRDVDQVRAKQVGVSYLKAATDALAEVAGEIPTSKLTASVKRRVENALEYANSHFDTLDHNASAADVYVVSDFVKKELQSAEKSLQFTATHTQDGTTREAAMKALNRLEDYVQEPFRRSLENTKIWGEAGEAQRKINAKWDPFLKTSARYSKDMQATDGVTVWADGRQRYYADSAKVQSWIEGVGTSRGQTSQELVRARIKSAQELLDAIDEYHPLDVEQKAKLEAARDGYKLVQAELEKIDKTVGIANRIEDVAKAERESSQLTSPLGGRVVGTVTGAIGAGPMGALMGGLGMLNKPAASMAAADQIRALVDRVGLKTVGSATGWVKSGLSQAKDRAARAATAAAPAVESAARTARKVAAPTSTALFIGKHKDLETAYEARAADLLRFKSDPDRILERVAQVTGGLHAIAPGLAGEFVVKAQIATDFLISKLPAGTADPTAFNPGRKSIIPRPELLRFARIWSAVERPESVVDDLRRGLATPDQIEAVRVCHPETYATIRNAIQDTLTDAARKGQQIPLSMVQQLDLLLDLGGAGEPALGPSIGDRIVALQAKQAQQTKQQVKSAPSVSRKAPSSAKNAALPQDRWPSA